MKTPDDKTVALTFMSHPEKLPELRWRATVTFPPGSTADTTRPVEVVDGNEDPVESGTLELAGCRMPVRNGRASLAYADFVKGKHSVPLWLYRAGMQPVPGGLTFA